MALVQEPVRNLAPSVPPGPRMALDTVDTLREACYTASSDEAGAMSTLDEDELGEMTAIPSCCQQSQVQGTRKEQRNSQPFSNGGCS